MTSTPAPEERMTQMESEALKPCPFCGGPAYHHNAALTKAHIVECLVCNASSGASSKAVEAWNRRSPSSDLAEALRELADAEADYRKQYVHMSDGHIATGRAWDRMRRAGDRARAALSAHAAPMSPEKGGDDMVEIAAQAAWEARRKLHPETDDGPLSAQCEMIRDWVYTEARQVVAALARAPIPPERVREK